MADDDLDDDLDPGGDDLAMDDEEALDASGGGGRKKLILLVVVPLLLVVGGLAGAYLAGFLDPVLAMFAGKKTVAEETAGEMAKPAVFYDLPELLVNLNTGGRKSSYLKMRVSLEVAGQEDVKRLEDVMPRIIDNFQVYLRELRVEDLKGSAGMYRLREELLTRVNAAVAPAKVNDVLFKEMLVQ
jgi:flagellar FliL protein